MSPAGTPRESARRIRLTISGPRNSRTNALARRQTRHAATATPKGQWAGYGRGMRPDAVPNSPHETEAYLPKRTKYLSVA